MALVLTAPDEFYTLENEGNIKVFLAGGITGCDDWQSEVISTLDKLYPEGLTLYNPRRKDFPINDPTASENQIIWEYKHLEKANIILYWFAKGTDNPIVLYELGMWGNSRNKLIVVGCDLEYKRKNDVGIQTKLARRELTVVFSLGDLIKELSSILRNVGLY